MSPLILLLLLISQLTLPYNSCRAGESCHDDEMMAMEEKGCCHDHDTDAAPNNHLGDTDHEDDDDCTDCSCNCCRIVVNFPMKYSMLTTSIDPHSHPASWLDTYLFELSEAIWQPPRLG